MLLGSKTTKLLVCLAVAAGGVTGCGGDDDEETTANEKQAPKERTTTTTATAPPTTAELKGMRCGDIEFGLTSTNTVFLVHAVAQAAGVDVNRAAETVEKVCKGKPRAKAYARAVEALGGNAN